MIVDLPLPVCPMRAMRSHLVIVKSISERTSRGLDGYANERFLKVILFFIFKRFLSPLFFSFSMANIDSIFS